MASYASSDAIKAYLETIEARQSREKRLFHKEIVQARVIGFDRGFRAAQQKGIVRERNYKARIRALTSRARIQEAQQAETGALLWDVFRAYLQQDFSDELIVRVVRKGLFSGIPGLEEFSLELLYRSPEISAELMPRKEKEDGLRDSS